MPDRPDVANGSAEAARWVADALRNARDWFPEMSEEQLREPLEQAFEMAGRAVRGEQEFHSVFEAELRRAIEERSVIGSAASVLQVDSGGGPPKTFPLVATAPPEPPELPPEPEPEPTEPPEPEPEPTEPPEPEPEPADAEPAILAAAAAEPEGDGDPAEALALRVGALRFRDGLSPDEIRAELGVAEAYYAEVMRWHLGRADRALEGGYPRHLDRRRMLSHAAGLASNEESFAVERHVRECAGCATYLADLFDATLAEPEAGPEPAAPRISYTRENTWTPKARPDRAVPALTLKAEELRGYARSAEAAAAASPPVDAPEIRPIRAAPRPPVARRPARRRALPVVALVATMLVVGAAGVVALTSGGDDAAPEQTAGPDAAAERKAGAPDARVLARAREKTLARKRAAARERAARERARARARRRNAQLRRQQAQRRAASAPDTETPAPVSPAPAAPSGGSGGSSEFGLEP